MKTYPDQNYYYNTYHYWLRPQDDMSYVVGITPNYIDKKYEFFAVFYDQALGFTYQKEQVGSFVAQAPGEEFGQHTGFHMPFSGYILEVNRRLTREPKLWHENPFMDGWLFKMAPEDPEELKTLMNAQEYAAFVTP